MRVREGVNTIKILMLANKRRPEISGQWGRQSGKKAINPADTGKRGQSFWQLNNLRQISNFSFGL